MFLDRCAFTPTAGGTTDFTVSAALTGFQTPATAGAVNAQRYSYMAQSVDLSEWEYGYATYSTTGPKIQRTKILGNSSAGTSAINFSVAPNVYLTVLGSNFPLLINVKSYGATGDGTTDDTTSVNAAIADLNSLGGRLYFPAGTYAVSSMTTVTASGCIIFGDGMQSVIKHTAASGNTWTNTGQENQYTGLKFVPKNVKSSGYEFVFGSGSFRCKMDDIRIDYAYNGINVTDATETRLSRICLRYLIGALGINMTGTVGNGSYRLVIDDILTDNPWQTSPTAALKITRPQNGAVTLGQYAVVNGYVWQVVTAGTTANTATGSLTWTPANTDSTSWTTTNQSDGSAAWRLIFNQNLSWVVMDNYAQTLVVNKAALIDGLHGIYVTDGASTGSSYPGIMMFHEVECDHSYSNCIEINAGNDLRMTNCWLSSSLTGRALSLGSGIKGDYVISNTRMFGCATDGMLLNGGKDVQVMNCTIGSNGQLTAATYHGIVVGSGVSYFQFIGNRCGDVIGNGASQQNYGIFINGSCDHYNVVYNSCHGNSGGAVNDGSSGTRTSGTVTGNIT